LQRASKAAHQFKGKFMVHSNDMESQAVELERNAYNATFYELGFRWHWDSDTYTELTRRSPNEADQIQHYLSARQPHLLKAYDAEFLVDLIRQKQAQHRSRIGGSQASRHFDWSQTISGELGA
jgi:hypothetical protein